MGRTLRPRSRVLLGAGLLVLAAGAGAAAGCAVTRAQQREGWVASRTDNVTVYTNTLMQHRFPQEWLEQSFAAFAAFFPGAAKKPVDVVFLAREPGSLLRFHHPLAIPRDSWSIATVPGNGNIGRDGLLILEDRRSHHEAAVMLAHQFVARAVPNAPLWLQVGLSRYLAGYRMHYQGNVWLACFGSPAFPAAPNAAAGRVLMPLDDLFGWDWYRYESWRGRNWYGYTAHVVVHFLIHGGVGTFHRERFRVFLDAIGKGASTDEALGRGYPHILDDEWEDAIATHARPEGNRRLIASQFDTIPQGLCFRIPPADRAARTPSRTPVAAAEIGRVLDDLQWIDVFRKSVPWMPPDIVAAEAARRKSPRGPETPSAPAAPPSTKPPTRPGDTPGQEAPTDESDTPVLRETP